MSMKAPVEMVNAYITAALWSSTGDDEQPLDKSHTADDIAPEALESMRADCDTFYAAHSEDIGARLSDAGHDLWLTRNGHGAGFWDGDWPDDAGKRLTDAAHDMGEVSLYVGDDGKIC